MGRIGWLIVGGAAGLFLGKFLFSLPASQLVVGKIQNVIDPIDVDSADVEFSDELGELPHMDAMELDLHGHE